MQAANLSFGPVVERVLPDQPGGQGPFMNFESGELVVAPNGLVENRFDRTLLIDWLVAAGADASAIAGENGGHSLVSYTRDTCFSEVSPGSWERMNESGLLLAWQSAARTNKIFLGNPDLLPRTFVFETRTGIHGLLQITGFTDNPRGVKIRYKLVQNGNASNINSDISAAMLAEPPKLQFLAWQDEWVTNRYFTPFHPDGSEVTDPSELKIARSSQLALFNVNGEIERVNMGKPRLLTLWFSHPSFDLQNWFEVTLTDDSGHLIPQPFGTCGLEQNDNPTWKVLTLSAGAMTNLPARVTVQMRYTVGPLERTNLIIITTQKVQPTLEGESMLNGVGQTMDGKAFVSIAVNASKMKARKFGVVAVTKDGRELSSSPGESGFADGTGASVAEFDFGVPLADVAGFTIGTRPIRTNEWRNVVLPKN